MAEVISRLKAMVHEVLGGRSSQIFLSRVDKTIDEATDADSLAKACEKVAHMVDLFIGANEAKVISTRCREILGQGK